MRSRRQQIRHQLLRATVNIRAVEEEIRTREQPTDTWKILLSTLQAARLLIDQQVDALQE